MRPSKRRWWEGERIWVIRETGKRVNSNDGLDGLPFLEEDAREADIVELGPTTGVEFGAREMVPRVDHCGAKGPPGDGTPWTRKRDRNPRAEEGQLVARIE